MNKTRLLCLLLPVCLLIACGGDDSTGVVPKHQMQALDKAKNVEQELMQAEKKRLETMEENNQ